MPAPFRSLDLLRALHQEHTERVPDPLAEFGYDSAELADDLNELAREVAESTLPDAVQVLAECEDCGIRQPCRLYRVGPTAPDGGDTSLAICPGCRAEHESLEVTP